MTKKQSGRKVGFNLFALRRRLELARGKAYPWEQIAKGTGLHVNTIYALSANNSKRVDLRTMAKLLDFFNSEGLEIGAGDLFIVEMQEEENED